MKTRHFLTGLLLAPGLQLESFSVCAKPPEAKPGDEGAALIQSIAEATKIEHLKFTDADLPECISYLRKMSQEKAPDKTRPDGLNFVVMIDRDAPIKSITIDVRNVTLWEAIQKVAAAAGAKVTIANNRIVVHDAPLPSVIVAGVEKSAVWKHAATITIDRTVFAEGDLSEACAYLRIKSRMADKTGKGVEVAAGEDIIGTVTLDLRNIKLTDLLVTVAELTGTEITVSGDKIVLKPKPKEAEKPNKPAKTEK